MKPAWHQNRPCAACSCTHILYIFLDFLVVIHLHIHTESMPFGFVKKKNAVMNVNTFVLALSAQITTSVMSNTLIHCF